MPVFFNKPGLGGGLGDIVDFQEVLIGPWDMDTDPTLVVPHGQVLANIRMIQVMIYNDGATDRRDLTTATNIVAGSWGFDGTNITLTRAASGLFDSVSYNDNIQNRGHVIIGLG